jgi:hypothetical protein
MAPAPPVTYGIMASRLTGPFPVPADPAAIEGTIRFTAELAARN